MTDNTPKGQLTEALRPIQRFEVVDCIDSKHVPAVIPNASGPWVRYQDHAAQVDALTVAPGGQANTKTHELLSTMIGLFLRAKEKIGYQPGSAIDKTVAEAVEHLKDWPYPETATPAQPVAQQGVAEALEDFEVRKLAAIGAVSTSSGLVERRPIEYRRELETQFVRGFRAAEKRFAALRTQQPAPAGATGCDTPNYCSSVQRCTAQDEARAQPAPAAQDHAWGCRANAFGGCTCKPAPAVGAVAGPTLAPSAFVNAAGIKADDKPCTVVRKLDAAFHDAVTFAGAAPTPAAQQGDA